MAQTFIKVPESTGNVPATRRVIDIDRNIAYVDEDEAPVTAILMKAKDGSRTVHNSEYSWIEKEMYPDEWDAIDKSGGYSDSDTALVVDDGTKFYAGALVKVVRTSEVLRVTAVSTNTLTVVRSVGDSGGTDAAAILDNDELLIISTAYAEGSDSPTVRSHVEVYVKNFTEIFKTSFAVTGTQAASENYTGPDRPRLRREKAREHRVQLEKALLFGERNQDTTDTGKPIRYTGGLDYYLDSNIKSAVGTLTEPEVEDWAQDLFQRTGGASTRLWIASPLTISVVDQLAAGRLQVVPKEDTFGVAIKRWVTGHGDFNLVKHPLLINGYAGDSFGLDPKRIKYCPLRTRNTQLETDIQDPDEDVVKDQYLTEAGFAIMNPEYHGRLRGVTA